MYRITKFTNASSVSSDILKQLKSKIKAGRVLRPDRFTSVFVAQLDDGEIRFANSILSGLRHGSGIARFARNVLSSLGFDVNAISGSYKSRQDTSSTVKIGSENVRLDDAGSLLLLSDDESSYVLRISASVIDSNLIVSVKFLIPNTESRKIAKYLDGMSESHNESTDEYEEDDEIDGLLDVFEVIEEINSHLEEIAMRRVSGLRGRNKKMCPPGSRNVNGTCKRTSMSDRKKQARKTKIARRGKSSKIARKAKIYRRKRAAKGL